MLSSFVTRINEDLRRDENRVGPYHELRYFDVLSKVLQYNRMLLEEELRQFEFDNSLSAGGPVVSHSVAYLGIRSSNVGANPVVESTVAGVVPVWEPSFINIMPALDRMSFSRVLSAIDRLLKPATAQLTTSRVEEHWSTAVIAPMKLYKEMLGCLHLLLRSGIEGHHEIAIAALFRLFYATTERGDPLPKLLQAWRPGTFPKIYLEVLLEIVTMTLNTMDAARSLFKAELESGDAAMDIEQKQKKLLLRLRKIRNGANKGKGQRTELDMEQYLLASMRFDIDEYFKSRLVSNHTVKLYTKVLALHKENTIEVNRNVFFFLRRMCTFQLEQDFLNDRELPSVSADGSVLATGNGPNGANRANLGYLLFNVQTMMVFSNILNDPEISTFENQNERRPLLNLIKSIIRSFGELASKNHLLYVEALFSHPHAANFCCSLESVYDASLYMSRRRSALRDNDAAAAVGAAPDHSSIGDSDSSDDAGFDSGAHTSSEDDEFDDMAAFAQSTIATSEGNNTVATKKITQKAKRTTKEAAAAAKGSTRSSGRLTTNARRKSDAVSDNAQQQKSESSPMRNKKYALEKSKLREAEKLQQSWTAMEDAALTSLFARYKGTHGVFASIMHTGGYVPDSFIFYLIFYS